jgi:hypothetical protein
VKRVDLWMALTTRGIHLTFLQTPGYQPIQVPLTNPVLLEVSTEHAAPRLAQVLPGQPLLVPLPPGTVKVRTLLRELLQFQPSVHRGVAAPETSQKQQTSFMYDVYVSYSHFDEKWVQLLVESLKERVLVLTGREPRIWREEKLSRSSSWNSQIDEIVRGSALLLAVISPSYLNSEFCRREYLLFLNNTGQTGGVLVGKSSRVLPVFRLPVPEKELPREFRELQWLKFYDQGTLEEFDSASPEFRKLVNQCARGIEQTLGEMRRQRLGIYVVATDDLRTQRQRLCTEFENRGYRALPEYSFLKDESGEVLSQSRAGIFMIGQTPDDSLDAEYRLVLEELNTGRDFRPFVWTPRA